MKITLHYMLTEACATKLFVELGRPRNRAIVETVSLPDLGPEGRRLLTETYALRYGAQGRLISTLQELRGRLPALPEREQGGMRRAADIDELSIEVPTELDDYDPREVPGKLRLDPIGDAITVLVTAAARTAEVLAEIERAKEEERAEREAEDAAILAGDVATLDRMLISPPYPFSDTWGVHTAISQLSEAARRRVLDEQALRTEQLGREREKRAEAARREAAAQDARVRSWMGDIAPQLCERYDAGVLPTEELHRAIRVWLFAPLDGFERFEKIGANELEHAKATDDYCTHAQPEFHVCDATDTDRGLTAEEWKRFREIEGALAHRARLTGAAAPNDFADVNISARVHRGWCGACSSRDADGRDVWRASAKVSIRWNGADFSREYAL